MPELKKGELGRVLSDHAWRMKGRLVIAGLCIVVYVLAELVSPWPLKVVFDHVLLDKPVPSFWGPVGDWFQHEKTAAVVLMSLAILLIAAIKGSCGYAQIYSTSLFGNQLVYRLRQELFGHLQRLSLSFHSQARSGELLTKVTSDTKALKELSASAVVDFPAYVAVLCGMLVVMMALNWRLGLVVSATLPFLSFVLFRQFRNLRSSATRQRKNEGKMASRLSEALASMTLLQTFGREQYEAARFDRENAKTLAEGLISARNEAGAMRIVEIVGAAGQSIVILLGAFQVLQGRMTPGEVLIFSTYVGKMFKPVENLAKLLAKVTKAQASMQRIGDILNVQPEVQDAPNAIDVQRLQGDIEFDHVSFDYDDGKHALREVSFHVPAGTQVALVGPSGAGKSTLAALLPRLFDPQAGCIRIDGVDLRQYRRDALRKQIGVVLQESFLSGTTVRENILYGDPTATEERLVEAARAASAHDFIVQLPHGYDTVLGEKGVTLSGGQRQRLALARALIRPAPILILDEPMTGLDVGSEAHVRRALKRLMAGRTCLLITHDLALAAEADWILVMEGGRIIEQGTHAELSSGAVQYTRLQELNAIRAG